MASRTTVVVKVHLMNNSSKAFAIDPNDNAQKLREMVIERLGLVESRCFVLFEKKEDFGLFFCFFIFWVFLGFLLSFWVEVILNETTILGGKLTQPATERCLDPDEKPAELMKHWEKVHDKKKGEDSYNAIFLFKKKIFLKDEEKEMKDSVAMDLVYQQAGLYYVVFLFLFACFLFLRSYSDCHNIHIVMILSF